MKKQLIGFIFYFFQGASSLTLAIAISKWGKFTSKDYVVVFAGFVCAAIAITMWYKYKSYLEGLLKPGTADPKSTNLYYRHPSLVRYISLVTGIFIAFCMLSLLDVY